MRSPQIKVGKWPLKQRMVEKFQGVCLTFSSTLAEKLKQTHVMSLLQVFHSDERVYRRGGVAARNGRGELRDGLVPLGHRRRRLPHVQKGTLV